MLVLKFISLHCNAFTTQPMFPQLQIRSFTVLPGITPRNLLYQTTQWVSRAAGFSNIKSTGAESYIHVKLPHLAILIDSSLQFYMDIEKSHTNAYVREPTSTNVLRWKTQPALTRWSTAHEHGMISGVTSGRCFGDGVSVRRCRR
jgi:hypothetical protein